MTTPVKINYAICSAQKESQLENQVNRYIADGWEPLGGVVVSPAQGYTYTLFQTMIKKEDNP